MTERQRPYYICDGCGYEIKDDSEHGMLTLAFKRRYKLSVPKDAKHFHGPRDTGAGQPKGKTALQDCLDYWWHNRKARELAEGKDW